MAFPPRGNEGQVWLPSDNAAFAPFTGNQRPKGNGVVSPMQMRPPVPPPQGFNYPVRQGPMTDYRPSGHTVPTKSEFPRPPENRFQPPPVPIPSGGSDGRGSRPPVKLSESGSGGKKCIGTGVFIPTGRRGAVASVRNNQTYQQPRIEEKSGEDVSPELCLPAEWIY